MNNFEEEMKKYNSKVHRNSIWVIVLGVLMILLGVFALIYMGIATLAVVYFFGTLMVIGGVFQIIGSFQLFHGSRAWLWALCGLLYLLAGWIVFSNPFAASLVFTLLLAAALLVGGVFRIINGFQVKPHQGWSWAVLSGALGLITGILIIIEPNSFSWVMGLFLGVDMLFQGWTFVVIGWAIRSKNRL